MLSLLTFLFSFMKFFTLKFLKEEGASFFFDTFIIKIHYPSYNTGTKLHVSNVLIQIRFKF